MLFSIQHAAYMLMIPNNVVFIILFVKKPVISNREITFFNKVFNDKVHTHITFPWFFLSIEYVCSKFKQFIFYSHLITYPSWVYKWLL